MQHWVDLKEQRRISTLKTITFAQAAHEFRNPLNGIIASLDLLDNYVDK